MQATRLESSLVLGIGIALLGACQDGSQSPTGRGGPPLESDRPAGSMLEPVDLVYICGNKFLATNDTEAAVRVTPGATGTMVDVYRNKALIKTAENDGRYTNTRQFVGAASYTCKLCQARTTVCSNEATVVF